MPPSPPPAPCGRPITAPQGKWREVPWPFEGSEVTVPLKAGQLWLDSAGPLTERARWSLYCPRPSSSFRWEWPGPRYLRTAPADARRRWMAEGLEALRTFKGARSAAVPAEVAQCGWGFGGGLVGMLSYEGALALQGVNSRHRLTPAPPLSALLVHDFYLFDRHARRAWQVGAPPPLEACRQPPLSPAPQPYWRSALDAPQWCARVERLRAHIAAGDVFQANYTMQWHAPFEARNLAALYQSQRTRVQAPFGAFYHLPSSPPTANSLNGAKGRGAEFALLASSVERFIALDRHGWLETRPIKGTAPRSAQVTTDAQLKAALAQDPKERAENLMITDLMRHDLGIVAEAGSVSVPELLQVESFERVHHLVSAVRARLKAGLDGFDILQMTTPPGSVTGAPKRRALEIIDALEPESRGAYCGTLFWMDSATGAMDSMVIIRSVAFTGRGEGKGQLSFGAGGGITWPSQAEHEWQEALLKAAPFTSASNAPS
ncbi:anthranilate synthase component I family protein [Formicincola oecophyllae]|uniref:Anthranilate synthase component I family protein n=1 Tax=Formicincola oecophyllae TaxID=2558361 RepID=A0A4Y6UB66_9PROT|nr:anthranilate synthase component I family protein [Formicincola oecophyllae]QDH13365.1 anthranilate synthase component I family protein [Formicincola oecophyllae]